MLNRHKFRLSSTRVSSLCPGILPLPSVSHVLACHWSRRCRKLVRNFRVICPLLFHGIKLRQLHYKMLYFSVNKYCFDGSKMALVIWVLKLRGAVVKFSIYFSFPCPYLVSNFQTLKNDTYWFVYLILFIWLKMKYVIVVIWE